jgi:hypothetical protein
MLKLLAAIAGGAGAIASFVAAYYWFRSSVVLPPAVLTGNDWFGGGLVSVNARPLVASASDSGRLNGIAALWSGVAASCFFISSVLGAV